MIQHFTFTFFTHYFVKRIILQPESDTFEIWKNLPVPLYVKFYLFNVTNALDVQTNGSQPSLKEVGPFTYRMFLRKTNIRENGDILSFREHRSYQFISNLSAADENIEIFTLNAPLAITAAFAEKVNPTLGLLILLGIEAASEGYFIKRSVKQLLFEGYPDPLTNFAPLINPNIPTELNGRFGYFFPQNNTFDGLYEIHSGKANVNFLNTIYSYNGRSNLSIWSTDECNSLTGTTKGELRPPVSNDIDTIKLFNSEICRVLKLNYNYSYHLPEGLIVKRFVLDENTFKNVIDYPPNSCYSSSKEQTTSLSNLPSKSPNSKSISSFKSTILPSGIFDLSKCKWGAPVFISKPHFLDADPFYFNSIKGLKPNSSLHSFYIDVEPITGSSISIKARLQLNVAVGGNTFRYRHVPNIIFPILWQEVNTQATPEIIFKLKLAQDLPIYFPFILLYLFVMIGFVLLLISLFAYLISIVRHSKQSVDFEKKTKY